MLGGGEVVKIVQCESFRMGQLFMALFQRGSGGSCSDERAEATRGQTQQARGTKLLATAAKLPPCQVANLSSAASRCFCCRLLLLLVGAARVVYNV
jgi:hypothetical protein